jgi:hypothetical protein
VIFRELFERWAPNPGSQRTQQVIDHLQRCRIVEVESLEEDCQGVGAFDVLDKGRIDSIDIRGDKRPIAVASFWEYSLLFPARSLLPAVRYSQLIHPRPQRAGLHA